MCGIVGYIGGREAVPLIVDGLRRLEYRGYDSAGVAVFSNGDQLDIRRAEGKLRNLEEVIKNKPLAGSYGIGHTRWATDADVVDLVRVLARQMPDESIAAVLNRAGKSTGRGNSWTRSRVAVLRHHRNIAPYRDGERTERGEVTLEEAADLLKVSEATVRRLISENVLPARQLCKGAPWVIRADNLRLETVRQAADDRRARRPSSPDSRQNSMTL